MSGRKWSSEWKKNTTRMEKSSYKNNILKNNTFKNIFLVISENYFYTIRVFL
jgi:hypothetical protein